MVLAKLGSILICSAMSHLLAKVLLFIVILEGEVCLFVFRLMYIVPINSVPCSFQITPV